MAKIKGPLMSLTASGSIAQTLTMLRQSGRNIAKRKSAPTGAPTTAQLERRAQYRARATGWSALSPTEQDGWRDIGAPRRITGFNAWMSAGLAAGAAPGGTQWDGGNAIWDGGSAIWS
jgi:hypothetical protein